MILEFLKRFSIKLLIIVTYIGVLALYTLNKLYDCFTGLRNRTPNLL